MRPRERRADNACTNRQSKPHRADVIVVRCNDPVAAVLS
jgi:hypothetical protein